MPDQRDEYHRVPDEQNRLYRAQATAGMFGQPEEGGGTTTTGRHTCEYYEQVALTKHPEPISDEWIERVLFRPDRVAINPKNGTISYWGHIPEYGNSIRVVLRERDGTLVNRFPDSQEEARRLRRLDQL